MRIIAGTARSLPLKTIEGLETRPTTDKIKETLFNMLQNDVPGCYFLDLFAGSGQIGLEAISRGALYAVFIENNRKAAKCIEDNIAFTKFTKESRLLTTDVISGISRKMIRRHPHVFSEKSASTPEDVLKSWDEIKAEEKAEKASGKPLKNRGKQAFEGQNP